MFYAENLPFCMADSNKYIGLINPHVYGFSFFSHNRIPFLAESCIFYRISQSAPFLSSHFSCLISLVYAWRAVRVVPKDPSTRYIYVVNYIGREFFTVKFALTMGTYMSGDFDWKEKRQLKEGRKRETEGLKRRRMRETKRRALRRGRWLRRGHQQGPGRERTRRGRVWGRSEEDVKYLFHLLSKLWWIFHRKKVFSWRTPCPKSETCFSFCTFIQVSQLGSNSNLKITF